MKTPTYTHAAAALACASLASTTASRTRMLAILSASLALAAPLAGSAQTTRQTPMDACVSAFVAMSLPKDQPVRIRKDTMTLSPLDALSGAYRISMAATGATSGKRYAKATCDVTRSGQVIALNGLPLPGSAAERAARAGEKTASR